MVSFNTTMVQMTEISQRKNRFRTSADLITFFLAPEHTLIKRSHTPKIHTEFHLGF